MSCHCCDEPPCGPGIIVCDSISASKSKCGFVDNDGAIWLTYKRCVDDTHPATFVVSDESPGDGYEPQTISTGREIGECNRWQKVEPTDISCCGGFLNEGSNYTTRIITGTGADEGRTRTDAFNSDCTLTTTFSPSDNTSGISGTISFSGAITIWEEEFSDLVSTEELIANTVAAMPDYPGTYEGACNAYRNLSADESSYTIGRSKGKYQHPPTGTCYKKVWLRKRFHPEDAVDDTTDVLTDLATYEWSGSGDPCLTDDTKDVDAPENLIEYNLPELTDPAEDGTISYEIKKWSCVEGYVPDDPDADPYLNPNGFPA